MKLGEQRQTAVYNLCLFAKANVQKDSVNNHETFTPLVPFDVLFVIVVNLHQWFGLFPMMTISLLF